MTSANEASHNNSFNKMISAQTCSQMDKQGNKGYASVLPK